MKQETFHLSTPAIRANCLAFISQLDDPYAVVTIKNKKETRSSAQQRLKWQWCGFMAKEREGNEGRSREGWNAFLKARYLKGILVTQDEKYLEKFTEYEKTMGILRQYQGETEFDDTAKKYSFLFWSEGVKTEWLNVANMSEFMTLIDRYCLTEFGVRLPVPDDLKYAYEGVA